jgi:hypothetical protein
VLTYTIITIIRRLPVENGVAGGGRKAYETEAGYEGLLLVVGHDGLVGSGELSLLSQRSIDTSPICIQPSEIAVV